MSGRDEGLRTTPQERLRELARRLRTDMLPDDAIGLEQDDVAADIEALLAALDAVPVQPETRLPDSRDWTAAIAEGLHKAMCFGPTTLHNRLACERPAIYLSMAEAVVAHPAVRALRAAAPPAHHDGGIDVERLAVAFEKAGGLRWGVGPSVERGRIIAPFQANEDQRVSTPDEGVSLVEVVAAYESGR